MEHMVMLSHAKSAVHNREPRTELESTYRLGWDATLIAEASASQGSFATQTRAQASNQDASLTGDADSRLKLERT